MSANERFWSKVDLSGGPYACHLWTAGLTPSGYGVFRVGSLTNGTRRTVSAHQWLWEQTHGEILIDPMRNRKFPLDHDCHNRAAFAGECAGGVTCLHRRCVNLRHIEQSTDAKNVLNSPCTVPAINVAKLCCVRGHEYTPENTYVWQNSRYCRACNRESHARLAHSWE